MPRLYVIAGHGAGDPGACANGATEAERVRALAKRMKELGGDAVTLHPLSDDAYASGAVSRLSLPPGTEVVELHMDSASPSARGGHVIIASGKRADECDQRLAGVVASIFPGRPGKMVSRSNLANANRAQRRGLSYRLVECGFISNSGDLATFNARLDDIARACLAAFGIGAGKQPTERRKHKMECIYRPNGANYLVYYDGARCHRLEHPDEVTAIQMVYRSCNGCDIPMFELGSQDAPWATRFEAAVERGM